MRRPLNRIDAALLPVVLLTAGDEACVLLGRDESGDTARLLLPETGQGSFQIARDELAQRYTGVAIYPRPHFRFDKRMPEVGDVKLRHWLRGALADQWPVYRDVLSAALLINVIAMVMPLFTIYVYVRVIPKRAMETQWVLALCVVLLLAVDLKLRLLRGLLHRPAVRPAFHFRHCTDRLATGTAGAACHRRFVIYAYVLQHKMHELSETTCPARALHNTTLTESLTD